MVRVQLTDCPDYSTVVFVMERKKVEDRGEWFGWPCFSMIRSHVTEGKKKKVFWTCKQVNQGIELIPCENHKSHTHAQTKHALHIDLYISQSRSIKIEANITYKKGTELSDQSLSIYLYITILAWKKQQQKRWSWKVSSDVLDRSLSLSRSLWRRSTY